MEAIFSNAGLLVMPLWFLMAFLPGWSWTRRLVTSPWSIAPVSALYAALVLPDLAGLLRTLANPSLESVAALLGTPQGATIAWAHFLAFDVFVGRWAYLDARDRGVPALLMVPVLFSILMVGPLGFLLYLLVRRLGRRPTSPERTGAAPATPV